MLSVPVRRAALAYDLIRAGRSLDDIGSPALSWSDLIVFTRRIQTDPLSALATEIHGHRWSITDQLLADLIDLTAIANWQRQQKKHAPKPKPIERPWRKSKAQKLGRDPIPVSEFDRWWDSH